MHVYENTSYFNAVLTFKKHQKNILEVWKKTPSYVWKLMAESSRKQKQLQRKNNENIHERICVSMHHIRAWKMHWIKKNKNTEEISKDENKSKQM